VLRRIFGPKMEHGTGAFRKCNNDVIYNALSLIILGSNQGERDK
jgi:hypothetical protein